MVRSVPLIARTLLALCLAVTSVTSVQAKARAGSLDQVVICTGYGIVQITVDAEGNPVQAIHACPDCVNALAASLPDVHGVARPAGMPLAVVRAGARAEVARRNALLPPARGPPLVG